MSSPSKLVPFSISSTTLDPGSGSLLLFTMADPVGILTSTFDIAKRVYDVVQTIRDAPDAIRALEGEAYRVQGLLSVILQHSGGQKHASPFHHEVESSQIQALLADAMELTSTVESLLAKAVTKNEDGAHKVKRHLWLLYAGDASKLVERFRAFYTTLTTVYVVSTSYAVIGHPRC